jgi:hypothetical protein
LIDDAVAVLGSANATYNSMELCREVMLTITEPEVVSLQAAHFDELWTVSDDAERALVKLTTSPVPSRPSGSVPSAPRGRSVVAGQSYSPPVPGLVDAAASATRRARSVGHSAAAKGSGSPHHEERTRMLSALRPEYNLDGVGNVVDSGSPPKCATAAENAFPMPEGAQYGAQMQMLSVLRAESSLGGVGNVVDSGSPPKCATAAENAFLMPKSAE